MASPKLVLLSGGMDSVACLHWALARAGGEEVRAIGFDYGQPHRDAELTAAGRIAKRRMVPFDIELLPSLRGGLRDGVRDHADGPGISPAFVPGRNGTFLWRALNAAARYWYGDLVLVFGACLEDAEAFPDCRPKFFNGVEQSMNSGLDRKVTIATPLIRYPKAFTLASLLSHPEGLEDVQESWSCYRGTACGTCTACVLRRRAFDQLGVEDLGGCAEDARRGLRTRTEARGVMLLVSGATRTMAALAGDPHLGRLLRPGNGNRPDVLPWAVDNGAFAGFDADAFVEALGRFSGAPGCLWVAAPDVVADAAATLERFREWEPRLHSDGWPVAFVAQDGLDAPPWDSFECLFVGGSTAYKLGPEARA